MEAWDAIRSRRNVRTFDVRPIPEADLERVLEAWRLAPSARNQQAWDLVLVTGRDRLAALSQVWQGAGHVAGAVAALAVVAPEAESPRQRDLIQYDLGQATMQLMIAAADAGIATAHAAVEDQALARRLLGFPEGYYCAYLISLGYPAAGGLGPLKRLNRRPLDDVVHREVW